MRLPPEIRVVAFPWVGGRIEYRVAGWSSCRCVFVFVTFKHEHEHKSRILYPDGWVGVQGVIDSETCCTLRE